MARGNDGNNGGNQPVNPVRPNEDGTVTEE